MKRYTRQVLRGAAEATPLWFRPLPAVLLLAMLAGLTYASSLPNSFVFDDLHLVASNTQFRTLDQLGRLFGTGGWRTYRPVRTASYAIDYYFFGLNPAGFRAFNVFYHVLNGALVFVIFRAVLRQPRPALVAAILFIVHPIQTDSVTYISGRRDLLFTLFYLAGFYSFIRYRETTRVRHLCLAGGSYYLSLLSKEMAVTLPLICFCYDLIRSLPTPDAKGRTSWEVLKEGARTLFQRHKWFYSVIGVVFISMAWYFAFVFRISQQREMWGGGLRPTLLTSARIFAHYLKLMVFPFTLNADYSYNAFPISRSLADARVLVAIVVLGGAWWGIYRLLAHNRWAAFGGLWFFATLLPVSQIIPHHEMLAEHYLYLPSAGFFLTAALLLERLLARSTHIHAISAAFALVVLLLGVRTIVRNRDWKDDLTLWTKTVQTAPESARAHNNLGEVHLRQGRLTQAGREFLVALRIQPNDAANHDNLGVVFLRLGMLDEAEEEFRTALRLSASFPSPRANLGLVYLGRKQLGEAERELREALLSPILSRSRRAQTLNNLGIVYAMKGRQEEAEKAFVQAVSLDPSYADARANLGKLYLEKGMPREGASELAEAVRLKASDAKFHHLLGDAYYQQGMRELAAIELAWALKLKPDFPEARALLNKIIREREREQGRRG